MSVVFSNAFLSHTDRDFAKSLLESAFPAEERPSFEAMERRGDEYRLCVVQKDGKNIGVFGYWTFRKTVYIEHFAISEPLRNNGLGGEVLGTFLNQLHSDMQVVLEAELPDNSLAQRRIDFTNGTALPPTLSNTCSRHTAPATAFCQCSCCR